MPLTTAGVINKPLKAENLSVGAAITQLKSAISGGAFDAQTTRLLIQNLSAAGGNTVYVGIADKSGTAPSNVNQMIIVEPREILPLNYEKASLDKVYIAASAPATSVLVWQDQ